MRHRSEFDDLTFPDSGLNDETGGAYLLFGMIIVASWGGNWDHVSVSRRDRCPTWDEMEMVKRRFFKEDEVAYQLHMPPSKHINIHPYCLHMWRPHDQTIPLPPEIMV